MTDDVVGYRRPPLSGQFKQGVSGNPKGRSKGSKNFLTLLEQELAQTVVVTEHGKKKTITRLQAMVKRLVAGALNGDPKGLMTLVELLRRSGKFEGTEPESLLPPNYKEVLAAYVDSHQPIDGKPRGTTKPNSGRSS